MLPGAKRDAASVTPQGEVLRGRIEGVETRELRNIVTRNGVTFEGWRREWLDGEVGVEQALVVMLRPHAISAWHCHERQTDTLFPVHGTLRLVLYDGREGSATKGALQVYMLSPMRPLLVVVPPGVWHGLQNVEAAPSLFVNLFDRAYRHDDPDEWRLPADTDAIPFRF